MKNIKSTFKLFLTLLFMGCIMSGCQDELESNMDLSGDVDITEFVVPGAQSIEIDNKKKTIVITYSKGSNVSNITPNIKVSEGAEISPASGTALDLRSPKAFMVTNGNLFSRYTVSANVLNITAFLSHHGSVAEITDDDEKALADWFFKKYDAQLTAFVSFQDIKDGKVDLNQFKTVMWYLDGDAEEKFTMPEIAKDPVVLQKMTDWYKSGGNFYLLGYANQYIMEMGRLGKNYDILIGQGQGSQNPDTWGINVNIGKTKDQSGHGLFAGLALTTQSDGRKTFPVIGPGWKEDHNFIIWEIAKKYGLSNDKEEAYTQFTTENQVNWLGTWDGVGDYFMAGILEFLPNETYKGRTIFQGIGAIEWNQDANGDLNATGNNPNKRNVEKLAENAILYLSAN